MLNPYGGWHRERPWWTEPVKAFVQSVFHGLGFELRRIQQPLPVPAGSDQRPIANVHSFLEDIRARGFRPRGILDIGANAGHWSRMAAAVFPSVPFVVIEPQDEMSVALTEFVNTHPGSHYVKAGAGRSRGELVQTIWPDLAGSSFLPLVKAQDLESGRQRKTPIITIDELLTEKIPGFQPDLVKLDIQGFELEALAGAASLFGRAEVFISEASLYRFLPKIPLAREVIAYMADRGYEIYDVTEHLRRPSDGALGQLDFAFVKADGFLRKHNDW